MKERKKKDLKILENKQERIELNGAKKKHKHKN